MFPPQLYWLPIEKRIDFKLVNFTSPWPLDPQLIRLPYMPCHPIRTLRSSDQLLLQSFPTKSNFGSRAFCSAAPSVWNSLPYPVRAFLSSFKHALETHYFPVFVSSTHLLVACTSTSNSNIDTGV